MKKGFLDIVLLGMLLLCCIACGKEPNSIGSGTDDNNELPSTGFNLTFMHLGINVMDSYPLKVFEGEIAKVEVGDKDIVVIEGDRVYGKKEGKTTITVFDASGEHKSTATITVFPKDVPLAYCPAGSFKMGRLRADESPSWLDENPVDVTLTKPFMMSKYLVTVEEYTNFLNVQEKLGNVERREGKDAKGRVQIHVYLKNIPGEKHEWPIFIIEEDYTPGWNQKKGEWNFDDDIQKHPMSRINYYGAKAYAEYIGGQLPSEAQWEYACRSGSTDWYCYGREIAKLKDWCWYKDSNKGDGPRNVGRLQPNNWGIYDMHGNVYEWTIDDLTQTGMRSGGIDPVVKLTTSAGKIVRGGDYSRAANECRSAHRRHYNPSILGANVEGTKFEPLEVGFRVLFTLN